MAAIIDLTLIRTSHQPWGLRLQGGADFEKALTISSVTEGSPSQLSGLQVSMLYTVQISLATGYVQTGDILLQINGLEAMLMTHKQGQDAIISAGDNVPLVVQRFGGPDLPAPPGTWRPSVELIGGPATAPASAGHTYTKTSLAANPVPEVLRLSVPLTTADYPQDTHWDVKHNITAKGFQPSTSSLPSTAPAPAPATAPGPPGFKSISAPITKQSSGPAPTGPPRPQVCWKCGKPIIGVFLQIKGKQFLSKKIPNMVVDLLFKADQFMPSASPVRSANVPSRMLGIS